MVVVVSERVWCGVVLQGTEYLAAATLLLAISLTRSLRLSLRESTARAKQNSPPKGLSS